uniref:Uncharacterized protein n=1 Tax=Leersia perrieri TaxID=77586 RepID=A0A0D9XXJ3_9ORYZ
MQGARQPMRIYCREDTNLNMAVRGNRVLLVRANLDDESQHWFLECDNVGRLTDEEGWPAFALVNRTTGHALVYWPNTMSYEAEVGLAPYSGHVAVEVSMLWSLGRPLDGGFSEIRILKNVEYTLNGLNGNVQEGTIVGIYWSQTNAANADYSAMGRVTDDQGRRAFALVNVGTKQAVLLNRNNFKLEMAPYNDGDRVKISMLWSLGVQLADGYREVRVLRDISMTLNGIGGSVRKGTEVGIYNSQPGKVNAVWKFDPID